MTLALILLKSAAVGAAVVVFLVCPLAACMLSSRISREEEDARAFHFRWPR